MNLGPNLLPSTWALSLHLTQMSLNPNCSEEDGGEKHRQIGTNRSGVTEPWICPLIQARFRLNPLTDV